MKELTKEQFDAFCPKNGQHAVIDVHKPIVARAAPDGKFYLLEGMEDMSEFKAKYGKY